MKRGLFILLFGLAAGCARFHSQPIAPEKTAAELQSRSLTNAALRSFLEKNLQRAFPDWPAVKWDFGMLTLATFYYQPSLDVARADWAVAEGGTRTAAGRLNPTVSAGAGYDTQIPGNFSPWLPAVTFDVPVETAGKRQRRIEQAKHASDSARFNVATAAWQARSDLRAALIDFLSGRRRADLSRRQVDLQRQINGRLAKQLEAGAIAVAELTTARAALARANADDSDAQRRLVEARVRVAEVIGVPVAALDGISLDIDLSLVPPADELISADARSAALRSRADILGALADYAASQSALQLEIARQYPDVRLAPGYSWNQGNAGDSEWQLGLSIELPLLNQNQGPIAEAVAKRAASAARFVALQAKVIAEIDRSVAVYQASRENVTALQSLAAAQQAQYEAASAQFRAGAADQLQLLGAQIDYNNAALAELDAQTQLQQSLGALEDAVQRPLTIMNPSVFEPHPQAVKESKP